MAVFLRGLLLMLACVARPALADVSLNNMFGDHMVLQQGQRNRVWGKADPGEAVTVTLGGRSKSTTAAADGGWHVHLDPVQEYGGPHELVVKGKNTLTFTDVLIGEVWICSGQSNMQRSVAQANDADVERLSARYPQIRLLTVPQLGSQEPQWNFDGRWQVCSPETVGEFSAVGFFFGLQLHRALGVPVGLVDNAWGGSSAEAWVKRERLAAHPTLKAIHEQWAALDKDPAASRADYERRTAEWRAAAERAKAEGRTSPRPPLPPELHMQSQFRAGNIYGGMLSPSIGYGIKGVIWYQGESNVGRARQYRELFPLLIRSWREEWGLGDFPFYWVQLADYGAEKAEPGESGWAELREAQTMTMQSLPATGQAVAIDLGEGNDIHPLNKRDVAIRLARWALSETYGIPGIACRSPLYRSMEKQGRKIVLAFDNVGGNGVDGRAINWRPFDVTEPRGFTIAGSDRKFVPAKAAILPDGRIEVWSESVADPAAVRYAWADNPVCNMYTDVGLPLTPFRTDD